MNNFLQRYGVGKRLAAAFAFLLALMALIALVASIALSSSNHHLDEITQDRMVKTSKANELYNIANQVYLNMQGMLLADTQEEMIQQRDHLLTARANFDNIHNELSAMPTTPTGRGLIEALKQARNDSVALNNQVIELALAGDTLAARTLLNDKAVPGLQGWRDAAMAVIKYQTEMADAARNDAIKASTMASTALWLTFGVAVIAGAFLGWQITRSLTLPLASATKAARDLAQGRLDAAPAHGGKDEVGEVLRAIGESRQSILTMMGGLQEMTRRHDEGYISFLSDTSELRGQYRVLGDSINALVSEHIGAGLEAGRLAGNYARGDLSEDFPRKPAEKAQLTNAMDSVKASIQGISEEILRVSQAAMKGDFSVRGDESRFEYGFRDMVVNLNKLMATADDSLGSLSGVLRGIAAGDLTVRMEGNYEGVFAQMRDDANATVQNLTDIVARIQHAANNINTAAGEIATGNTDLSRRTEQQAANLEETAASMEELTSTVRQNSEHAQQANQLAVGAHSVATATGKTTHEVVTTMAQIEESSRRIADIISVIDGIAFQTNILALNAAVEAARAGEQGRGFAVVASEVRSLAQRSAEAAKEIKALIDDSAQKVATGSQLVTKAGQTMNELVVSVQRVTDIMAEIAAASQEQTAGIEQVNQTVVQMDQATQQNAALVEEASAAARSMEEQAAALSSAVAVFRVA